MTASCRWCVIALFVAAIVSLQDALLACGHGRVRHCGPVAIPSGGTQAAEPVDKSWGTVKGRIIWGGKDIRKQGFLKGAAQKFGKIPDEEWVVNPKNKGLRDAFVFLVAPDGKLPVHPALQQVKEAKQIVRMEKSRFEPHTLCLRQGQTLVLHNTDKGAYAVRWVGHEARNPGGVVLLAADARHEVKDLQADRLPILVDCNIHPWMRAWVRVFNHPYYAITDATGAFALPNAPVGNFRLIIWHPSG